MEVTVIVTFLALLQYIYFGIEVGGLRGKSGVKAPAMAGDEKVITLTISLPEGRTASDATLARLVATELRNRGLPPPVRSLR